MAGILSVGACLVVKTTRSRAKQGEAGHTEASLQLPTPEHEMVGPETESRCTLLSTQLSVPWHSTSNRVVPTAKMLVCWQL